MYKSTNGNNKNVKKVITIPIQINVYDFLKLHEHFRCTV